MNEDHMILWQNLCQPPAWALKPIQAGRLKGKSDISPMWRMMAMTETFGPCGIGWKYTIDKLWLEKAAAVKSREGNVTAEEVTAFALVSVCYKIGDQWSEPIPGIGGSMFTEMEKSGPYNSDEAYKMAVTDALSVAFKALGVAANIYSGDRFDGSKYVNQREQEGQGTPQGGKSPAQPQNIDPKDAEYHKRITTALKTLYGDDKQAALDKVEEMTTFTPKGKAEPVKGVRNFLTLKGDRAKILANNLEKLVKEAASDMPPKCERCGLTMDKFGNCPDPNCIAEELPI